MSKFQTDPNVHPVVRAQRIIALSGPPAIGKSTTVTQIQKVFTDAGLPKPPVVSPDDFIYDGGIYAWTPERARDAWRRAYRKLENLSCATTDNPVILWDSTLTNVKARRQLLANWAHLCRAGSSWEVLQLASPGFETLVKRNDERTPDRQVPRDTMERMYNDYVNRDNFPTKREGWHKIWTAPEDLIRDLQNELIVPLQEKRRSESLQKAAASIQLSDNDFEPGRFAGRQRR
jgi:tRNA uridine 5-carbamoylmethylation protein Kti12